MEVGYGWSVFSALSWEVPRISFSAGEELSGLKHGGWVGWSGSTCRILYIREVISLGTVDV